MSGPNSPSSPGLLFTLRGARKRLARAPGALAAYLRSADADIQVYVRVTPPL